MRRERRSERSRRRCRSRRYLELLLVDVIIVHVVGVSGLLACHLEGRGPLGWESGVSVQSVK